MAKKKEAHHGGAWKVAYADFVTAMMALFMVLWITSQDKEILLATSEYFKQPFNALAKQDAGVMKLTHGGSQGRSRNVESTTAANLAFMQAIAKELYRMLHLEANPEESPVDVEVTGDGLRITVYDRTKQPVFEKNTAQLTRWGDFVLQTLAWIVERNRLQVVIDGHTPAGSSPLRPDYGDWELTADRANAARRLLEHYAVDPHKIERVTGYADTRPLTDRPPDSESNRRITVSLSLNQQPAANQTPVPYAKLP